MAFLRDISARDVTGANVPASYSSLAHAIKRAFSQHALSDSVNPDLFLAYRSSPSSALTHFTRSHPNVPHLIISLMENTQEETQQNDRNVSQWVSFHGVNIADQTEVERRLVYHIQLSGINMDKVYAAEQKTEQLTALLKSLSATNPGAFAGLFATYKSHFNANATTDSFRHLKVFFHHSLSSSVLTNLMGFFGRGSDIADPIRNPHDLCFTATQLNGPACRYQVIIDGASSSSSSSSHANVIHISSKGANVIDELIQTLNRVQQSEKRRQADEMRSTLPSSDQLVKSLSSLIASWNLSERGIVSVLSK